MGEEQKQITKSDLVTNMFMKQDDAPVPDLLWGEAVLQLHPSLTSKQLVEHIQDLKGIRKFLLTIYFRKLNRILLHYLTQSHGMVEIQH